MFEKALSLEDLKRRAYEIATSYLQSHFGNDSLISFVSIEREVDDVWIVEGYIKVKEGLAVSYKVKVKVSLSLRYVTEFECIRLDDV